MIKPITFQGNAEFTSNLYALEVKSRFIDQANANGYYLGYGNDLAAEIVGASIRVKSGAFVIQGRMNEVVDNEEIAVTVENGKVGLLCARIETYHPSDQSNTTFIAYNGASFDSIKANLIQQDVYTLDSETHNRVYECPIYSYEMSNNTITNLTRLLKPVADYATVNKKTDDAIENLTNIAQTAANAAQAAEQAAEVAATEAVTQKTATFTQQVDNAELLADEAATSAQQAAADAADAQTQATQAATDASNAATSASASQTASMEAQAAAVDAQASADAANQAAQEVAEKGGTVLKDANGQNILILFLNDILIDGGNS